MRKDQIEQVRRQFLEGIGRPEEAKFVIDNFQKLAIESAIMGEDTLVVAPTGAGKTFIAKEAMEACLLNGGRAIYTTPLKALSNGKFSEFKSYFEPKYSVGLLTGDRKIEGDSDVVVATTEIFRNELYARSENYSLVVLDEVHFIADQQRGAVWEESIILAPDSSTLLMLSASISNHDEISEWIGLVRGRPCKVVSREDRPVELRIGFLHPDIGVLPLTDDKGKVTKEVIDYYGDAELDKDGLRIKMPDRRRGDRRGRSDTRSSSSRRDGSRGRNSRGRGRKNNRGRK